MSLYPEHAFSGAELFLGRNEMKNIKQYLALLLAAAMVFTLAACGDTNVEETEAPEFVYKATYQDLNTNGVNSSYFYPTLVTGDGFYCLIGEVVGQRELEEGETLEWDGQLDIYETHLFRLGTDGSFERIEGYRPLKPEVEEGHDIYCSTDRLALLPDGGFLDWESSYESWSDSGDDVEEYSDEWYETYHSVERYYFRTLDKDGNELSCVEMDVDKLKQENEYLYFIDMVYAGENKVLIAGEEGLYIYDTQTGKMTGTINGIQWPDRLLTLQDGRVAVAYYGETGQKLTIVDVEHAKLGDSYSIQGDLYRAVVGGGDYDLYFNNGSNFYGYKLEEGVAEKLFNWINCDVDDSIISGYTVTDDGKVVAFSNEWTENGDVNNTLVTVEKVSSDTLPKKEVITLACQYLDWDARKQIIDFNRSHDSVRIELQDYSEFNTDDNYEAGLTKLRTELLAGNCPDIIDLDGLPAKQLAAKGLLADLYPLLDADPELSREDFFPAVLKALENDGKLYSTCSSFSILSAVGAAKVVGTEPGWTYEELMAALQNMPEGCTVFSNSQTRYDVLQMCLMLEMDRFVDWNTGKVSFDSPDFVALLNFVKTFPAEFDWENYEWTEEDDEYNRIRDGRQLLIYDTVYNFESILMYENIFGGLDAFTYVGFPTSSGVGNLLMTQTGYAICEKSQNKEAAWEFVRTFMTQEYQDANIYSLSSNIHSYELKKTNAMTPTYMKDAEGRIMVDPETGEKMMEEKGGYWDNELDEWVPVYSYSKEEIEKIESVINNTDRIYDMDQAINDIVTEQIEAFFAGQRSAEDVAKLIQSKAMIYVNEQR